MAEDGEKTPPTPSSSASCNDVEKGENIKILEVEEDNEPLEKAKEKAPPGINASLVLLYAVFFTMFTTGWINLNSCPVNRLIPIYLIVAGTYVVYKEYQPNYDPDLGIYCNRTAYLLSFWILTFQYTLLGIFIMLSGCYLLMNEDFKKC
ncbi:uncharacterized protein LOC130896663 isoform X2 [Diorhabda carinulata]|uniref:uncharacterized protein LOC130896663 isoform X2 n=1 Tax=Diorhabda carinulata TaxID=1163345 RepID=UPI0025A06BB8|nr:uncharacterized protein LOC130896663 isoform X2 [Diorhabda carinulata]